MKTAYICSPYSGDINMTSSDLKYCNKTEKIDKGFNKYE